MKKVLPLLLSIIMITGILAGCTNKNTQETTTVQAAQTNEAVQSGSTEVVKKADYLNYEGMLPIVKDKITLKVVTGKNPNSGSAERLWFWQWAEENTNIKFEVTQLDAAAWGERKSVMFAAGDLPDIFLHTSFTMEDILRFGQIEKMLLPMNELIDQYAPNIKNALSKDAYSKATITCPDGNIYNLPSIGLPVYGIQRAFINTAWLKALGLNEPETLDDLYDVLKAFKDNDPDKNGKADTIPFGGSWDEQYSERTIILSALGFNTYNSLKVSLSPDVKNGKVLLPEADPLYAEYLKYMNKLFTEGLLDKNIFTQTQVQFNAISSEGKVGLALDGGAPHLIAPNNWKEYESLKPLTSQWSSEKMWPGPTPLQIGRLAISNSTKYPEAAVRFADMFFSEEASTLFWYGPEKDSKDTLEFEGWFINDNAITYNYPEGITNVWNYMCGYLNPLSGGYLLGYNDADTKLSQSKGIKPSETDLHWRSSIENRVVPCFKNPFPSLFLAPEQQERASELSMPIQDYCRMMEAKFITGSEPIANIDNYFKELKDLGVDEYIKIYQDAYDVFQKNTK